MECELDKSMELDISRALELYQAADEQGNKKAAAALERLRER